MKVVQEQLSVRTQSRAEMVDVTAQVEKVVAGSGIMDGDAIIFCPHTTAAVTINENADPSVVHDILMVLDELIPRGRAGLRHSEGNSDSHCKGSLIGCSQQVLVKAGRLWLGTWQGIYLCEFDGPRTRRLYVQVRGV